MFTGKLLKTAALVVLVTLFGNFGGMAWASMTENEFLFGHDRAATQTLPTTELQETKGELSPLAIAIIAGLVVLGVEYGGKWVAKNWEYLWAKFKKIGGWLVDRSANGKKEFMNEMKRQLLRKGIRVSYESPVVMMAA